MTTENSNVEHECTLLNRHELSRSQQHELQRFIDANSDLLRSRSSSGTGDSSTCAENKGAERSNKYRSNYGTSSVHSNKGRKEVKWSDNVHPSATANYRTRSLSPAQSHPSSYEKNFKDSIFDDFYNFSNSYSNSDTGSLNTMSNYGSTGYLNRGRDYQSRTYSPATNYHSYERHPDDYNRYETARSRSRTSQRQREEEERSRFSGYGDRPGSGVELMPTKWHGGEIITDPGHLPRSLKPRRLYYSPIGDGVVAADGIELKRVPKDLSPRISVTHTRTVDRGEPGQDGYNLYSRTVTHGSDYGSDLGGSGRDSRLTGGLSPGSDSYGQSALGREPDYKGGEIEAGRPGSEGTVGGGGTGGEGGVSPNYDRKDYSPRNYSDGFADSGSPSGRGGYTDGTRGRGAAGGYGARSPKQYPDGYGMGLRGLDGYGVRSRGTDVYGSGSPNYSYHSPTAAYQHSPASHDPHSTLGSARSGLFVGDYGGRSQSADPLSGPDSYGDYGFRNDGRSSAASGFYGMGSSERSRKFDITKDYLITNPRELIHQYATTTPISVLEIPETSRTVKKMYSSTTEEKYIPYPPYKGSEAAIHPNNFTRQLRDEGLTVSQREANRHKNPLTNDNPESMQKISEIRHQTSRAAPSNKEIDYLTEKMMHGLQSGHPTPPQY